MNDPRATCKKRDRCGRTGHYRDDNGDWVRCSCLQLEINKRALGPMYTDNPEEHTKLSEMIERDLVIEGPLSLIRLHVARVLLDQSKQHKIFATMDAYRLIEIFLEKDGEYDSVADVAEKDLLLLLLGFGDPRNKYLPELVLQVIGRRQLELKPTWVLLGLPFQSLAPKYSSDLAGKLASFGRIHIE